MTHTVLSYDLPLTVEADLLFAILIRWQNNFVISLKPSRQLNFNFLWCAMYIVNRLYHFRFISNKWNITFISFSVLRIKTNRFCLRTGNTKAGFLVAWGKVRKSDVTHISSPWYKYMTTTSLLEVTWYVNIYLYQYHKHSFPSQGAFADIVLFRE